MTIRYPVRGMLGYAQILGQIRVHPSFACEIHAALGIKEFEASNILRRMAIHGVVHIERWASSGPGKHRMEVWKLGAGVSAPRPATTRKGAPIARAKPQPAFRPEVFSFCQVIKALDNGATLGTICDLVGIQYGTANNLIKRMRSLKLIHVSGWEKPAFGPRTRVYSMGNRHDAGKPPLETSQERNARYWLQKKSRRDTALMVGLTAGNARHPLAQVS